MQPRAGSSVAPLPRGRDDGIVRARCPPPPPTSVSSTSTSSGSRACSRTRSQELLERADGFVALNRQADKKLQLLRGLTHINLFFESSTRTQTSFELAGKRLGADVVNMSVASSAMKKGETLIDTAMTLNAMHPDVLVVRHQDSGAVALLARHVRCSVINAGDGAHEHPTQALLDALTIRRRKGRIEGLTVAICGDILHSRVARSNILLLLAMGARVRVVAPPPCCRLGSRVSASTCSPTCSAGSRMSTS